MIPSLSLEAELCKAYHAACEAFDADPFDGAKTLALRGAMDDLRTFIMADDGNPVEDLLRGVQFELDRNLEVQAMPLRFGRLYGWAQHGAVAVSPGYTGAR